MRWEAVLMNLDKVYNSIEDVLEVAQSAEGRTVGEFDINNRLESKGNKGGIGQILEEGLFKIAVNSRAEADFVNLGLELKVTAIKENKKNEFSAKERLVLNIINYEEDYKDSFDNSAFWQKNKNLLIVFYLYKDDLDKKEFPIVKSVLHEFDPADLEIIKQDWETIIDKIKQGEAHNISESDTMYLAACTKGVNANSVRKQPFSAIPAKQRAFSLKSSYMTAFARRVIDRQSIPSLFNVDELKSKTTLQLLQEKFAPYIGKSVSEIARLMDIPITKNKAFNANLISAVLGVKGTKLESLREFNKANIKFKTIRLEPNGVPREHMSFEQIDFTRWVRDDWEESQVYENFEYTKYLFVVFQYDETATQNKDREPYLKGIILWNMPEVVIEHELKDLWKTTKAILETGVELKPARNGVSNNLPGAKFNGVCHIRPKGKDGNDKVMLPDGQEITKQCYWLNREYIAEIVKKL